MDETKNCPECQAEMAEGHVCAPATDAPAATAEGETPATE